MGTLLLVINMQAWVVNGLEQRNGSSSEDNTPTSFVPDLGDFLFLWFESLSPPIFLIVRPRFVFGWAWHLVKLSLVSGCCQGSYRCR